ncbi:Hint domain-containing protein [Celeribacter naphthalenivorans]|uniref:Hint domain-containing protein n=1 Tax=Celeribacter naphthalenivorans TaxID=1614694 RepID=UPI001CFC0BE0|nr:Hint domain-containing protein [Celeribacter naphthalenivorans]
MALRIEAIDSQFAASTGSNVNSGPGTSQFDYPPTSTHTLIIESQPGDDSPYIFSPGDTYTLTFAGQGGDTIENATVVRSDYIDINGDSGYAVVFEGYDSNGELVQVVWTPEFDLEAWYWDNFSGGQPPGFYNTDQSAATTYQAVCFEASMPIETPSGPHAIGDLRPGDPVVTLDHGVQPIRWMASRQVRGWGRHAPVIFAPGSFDNPEPVVLSQQHRILLDLPEGEMHPAGRQLLVPAVSFVDGKNVRVRPRDEITYVHLLLEDHGLVSCHGVACESLYLGQVARDVLGVVESYAPGGSAAGSIESFLDLFAGQKAQHPARPFLTPREGQALLHRLAGLPERKPAMLMKRGRQGQQPYHLDAMKYPGAPGLRGLPAFERILELAA